MINELDEGTDHLDIEDERVVYPNWVTTHEGKYHFTILGNILYAVYEDMYEDECRVIQWIPHEGSRDIFHDRWDLAWVEEEADEEEALSNLPAYLALNMVL